MTDTWLSPEEVGELTARMVCHQCRKQIQPRPAGGWHRCCDGLGYWTNLRPLPADRCGGERNGLTFCPSTKWWRLQ